MIVIADSSGIISAYSKPDKNHKLAVKLRKQLEDLSGSIYIPAEVFAETINIAGKKLGHMVTIRLAKQIIREPSFLITESTEDIRSHALRIFQKQPESVSFTDCLVMAFADEYGTKEIFGFDEAFAKNGYKRVGIDR